MAKKATPAYPLDSSKLQIGDIFLFAKIASLEAAADPAAVSAAMVDILPVLDRIVVGGVSQLPYSELATVMQAVGEQLSAIGDAGN